MEKPDLAMNQDVETSLSIIVKWAGKEYVFQDLCSKMTVRELKERIREATNVLPERQRLLNLRHKGKAADDDVTLGAIPVKHNSKIMMMGSSEEVIKQATDQVPDQDDNVINDFDEKWAQELATEHRQEYLAKVEQRVQNYQVAVLHPPRPDKKLLVLDIDYTLFDHRSVAETGQELMRPFLHEFLASAYEDYDIVIWSATSMKWIEEKMKLLGCDKHPDYKLSFYLDYHAMISIHSPKYGVIEVKPLGVIWKKFPQYSKSNTIMFDDLQRNFLMNPSNGLKIRAFKKAHLSRSSDRELIKLTSYLKLISTMPTFEGLDHSKWESLIRK